MKLIKVLARPADPDFEDDENYLLTIYLLKDQNPHSLELDPSFGWRGVLNRNMDAYPFILFPDGRIDFGASYDTDSERFGICTIFNCPNIAIGAEFGWIEEGEASEYRVHKISSA